MVVNVTKISQQMKDKSLYSTEKIRFNEKKRLIIFIRKYFNFENFDSLQWKTQKTFFFCKG